jgi:N-ethylmaleimide reductase
MCQKPAGRPRPGCDHPGRTSSRGPTIAAGGFEPDTAEATVANDDAGLIAFGRHFIANPDLPKRIEFGLPLNHYDRSTFYAFDARGYTDYPPYEVHEADQACVD